MAASYKKLFKLLIDRDMKKKELAEKAGVSIATITKMGKDGAGLSDDVLVKICSVSLPTVSTNSFRGRTCMRKLPWRKRRWW